MKTVVSTCARVKIFTTSCCFSETLLFKPEIYNIHLYLSSNEAVQSIKTPAVHVRCDLTTQSTMFSRVGISALLSWKSVE